LFNPASVRRAEVAFAIIDDYQRCALETVAICLGLE
jgi:hypothetical protein